MAATIGSMKKRAKIFRCLSSQYTLARNYDQMHTGSPRAKRAGRARARSHIETKFISKNTYDSRGNSYAARVRHACHAGAPNKSAACNARISFATGHYATELIRYRRDTLISRVETDSLGTEINCAAVISVGFIARALMARPNLSENP